MKRLLTGLIITPFFFYTVVFAPYWFFALMLATVALLCYYEFLGIAAAHFPEQSPDLRLNPAGYAAGLVLLFLPRGEGLYLTLFALLIWMVMLRRTSLPVILPAAAATVFGVIYVFGAWRCGAGLRMLDPWWMFFALAVNWVGDTFAYYVGKNFGRHRLSPVISPKKSWEGSIASVVSALALGIWFLHWRFPAVGMWQAALLCICGNLSGQIGDLCESAIKRGAGVKDSGNLLPGHGGWLDRVDSSLFSVPVIYWLLQQPWVLP